MFFPALYSSLEGRDNPKIPMLFDVESGTELARLINQERLISTALGEPFARLPDAAAPLSWQAVLDLACGPGGWVLDVAFAHPHLEVAGIDSSPSMIDYARARLHAETRECVLSGDGCDAPTRFL